MPLPGQRHLFDLPEGVAYLRCAAAAPQLRSVTDAGCAGVKKKARPWLTGRYEAFDQVEELRAEFARLVNAAASDIAIVPSASYGIAVAARNLRIGAGRRVVVLDRQFPSHVYAWRDAVRRDGGEIVVVPCPASLDWTGAVLSAIDERTAVAALPQCHWTDGATIDLAAIGERCRAVGAALALDLSQSLGAVPFDVEAVRPDFMTSVAEKWLLGPVQVAFLYVAPQWQGGEPIEFNWINRKDSEDYNRLVDYRDAFQPGARRFDVGERGNFVTVPMAIEALRQINAWRVEEIAATIRPMIEEIASRATAFGFQPTPGPLRAPHMVGLRRPGLDGRLADALASEQVYVSVRDDAIRVAPHVYNERADIDRLFDALKRHL